jgi:outer membrane lipoprotein carrier protein
MKQIKSCFTLLLLLFSATALTQTPTEQLDSLLSSFKTMNANFQQTAIVKKGANKTSSGRMALQRPGKFRWEITSPNHQLIIADGKYLWIYDVDLEQASKQRLTKDAHSPAILLSGSSEALRQRFLLQSASTHGESTIFQLQPKDNQDLVRNIELQFVNNKLSQMSVIDNLGQKNIFYFSNVAVNSTLPSSLFVFHPPKGVDVIQN